jgi:pre-mRNA-processing factor 19
MIFFINKLIYLLVSNEVPEQPVLSPVSGCIYEKRLILKYLHDSFTDPINGQPLTEEQLIDVKGIFIVKKNSQYCIFI